jgi:hypothetical protein
MSYFWCHGPECHTRVTQDRVRGTKGSKVLRTRKIKQHTDNDYYNVNNAWNYFCSQSCKEDFWNEHGNAIRQIAPRTEPLETRIDDPKKETIEQSWGNYTRTVINKVDSAS